MTLVFVINILLTTPQPSSQPLRTNPTEVTAIVSTLKDNGIGHAISQTLSEILSFELARFPGLKIKSYADIKDILQFAELQQLVGCDDQSCFQDFQNLLKSQYLVRGAVGLLEGNTTIQAVLIDMSHGEAIHRVNQIVLGGDEDIIAAIRVVGINVISPLFQDRPILFKPSLEQLERLHTAERPKAWDASLNMGVFMPMVLSTASMLHGVGHQIGLNAQYNLMPFWLIGTRVDYVVNKSKHETTFQYADTSSGEMLSTQIGRFDKGFQMLSTTITQSLRKAYGLVLPFFQVGLGVAYVDLRLGDFIVDNDEFPVAINREMRGDRGWALNFEVGGGVDYLILDWLKLTLAIRIQHIDHTLVARERSYYANTDFQETEMADFNFCMLNIGVGFQR